MHQSGRCPLAVVGRSAQLLLFRVNRKGSAKWRAWEVILATRPESSLADACVFQESRIRIDWKMHVY